MIKQLSIIFLFALTLGVSSGVNAINLQGAEELEISETVDSDIYTAAGRMDVTAEIKGDIFAAGGEVYIDAPVAQDAAIIAGEITISQVVGDDLRVAGGDVTIEADVLGDVLVFGGHVRVKDGVTVHGDMLVFAGNIKHEGTLNGDLMLYAGKFSLSGIVKGNAEIQVESFSTSGSGSIEGDLDYTHNKKLSTLENITSGEITFEISETDHDTWDKEILGVALWYIIVKIIGVFIFSSLIYFYFENLFKRAAWKLSSNPGKSALYGFLLVICMPIVAILLMITVIGIPFGLLLFTMFIFMLVFAKLFNVMTLTAFIDNKYNLDSIAKKLGVIFGFTLLFCLVWIVNIITACFVLGALLMLKWEIIEDIRMKK